MEYSKIGVNMGKWIYYYIVTYISPRLEELYKLHDVFSSDTLLKTFCDEASDFNGNSIPLMRYAKISRVARSFVETAPYSVETIIRKDRYRWLKKNHDSRVIVLFGEKRSENDRFTIHNQHTPIVNKQ